LDIMTPAMKVAEDLMSIPSFNKPDDSILFAVEKEHIKKLKRAILMCAGKAAQHFAMTIEREQEVMMNLADMVIEVYTAESAILRAEKLANKNGEETTEHQITMSKLFLYQAIKNCNQSGEEVILSFAEGDEQRMLLMGLKRFTKGYTINPKEMRRVIASKIIDENKYCF
jgi:hypothetical protein